MKFKMGEYTLEPNVINSEIKKSKHTGNDLELLEITFKTDIDIEIPEFMYSIEADKKWKSRMKSSSFTQGNPVKTYILELEEFEELNIENIVINGVKFKPYFYKENIDYEDKLSIKANIKVDEENWLILKDFIYKPSEPSEITVIREGISDEELKMYFGKTIWSKNENEYKCRINLFIEDNSKKASLYLPIISNIKLILLEKSKTIDNLLSLLLEKELINESEKENILKEEEIDFSIFDETKDLDKFLEIFL
ncbi:hypothetical protein [Methanobacterium sp. ACI-7]|uniref:hypothetical protein n=1 Tax=unclassified Methanobacterium TaxID=2627676 RepID=UPI0039C08774